MQKSDVQRLIRNNYYPWNFNTKDRDRPGGHYSPSSNHKGHKWWKNHDRKIQRRKQKKIKMEALKAYYSGELTPCYFCGELHEGPFCHYYDEAFSYDLDEDYKNYDYFYSWDQGWYPEEEEDDYVPTYYEDY